MKHHFHKDYTFIKVGFPVVPRGIKEVVYITEILGENIFTTNGCYKKEQLNSIVYVSTLLECFSKN